MPRRSSTRFQLQPQLSSSPPPPQSVNGDHLSGDLNPMFQLRTQWKWAAFSQFFFTFNHLFAMNDVSLNDIEGDLVSGSSVVLPRIMQRLLYTLSYDRKVSLDNWQTALRKQYRKRDPASNPIGPEPREATPEPEQEEGKEEDVEILNVYKEGTDDLAAIALGDDSKAGPGDASEPLLRDPETTHLSILEPGPSDSIVGSNAPSAQPSGLNTRAGTVDGTEREETQAPSDQPGVEDQEESKNWLELPMLAKLESMHTLMEWQFQNPTRLRTLMRSDDDAATWRIEPIGYDSKKNAYWLIGADRLWIQRPIPRPPRPGPTADSLKRKRSGNNAKIPTRRSSKPVPGPKSVKRPRVQTEFSPQSSPSKTTGRGSRAAKNEANLKLDQQAKELAALNKQAKTEAGLRANRHSLSAKGGGPGGSMTTRSSKRGGDSSPPKSMGTRVSRRLRGAIKEDDEWQAVPEEWLNGEGSSSIVNGKGRKSSGKGKAKAEVEAEAEDEEYGDGYDENEDDKRAGKKLKTGLESDGSEISDLTELSDLSEEKAQSRSGDKEAEKDVIENSESMPVVKMEEEKAIVPVPQIENRGLEEPPVLPVGFIEWETICVTLYEWDHIAEGFEKATHYTEKALYKVLVKTVVPVVTEELREIERKHQLSLALTQRKRSSRLLLRQSEKEEAEAAARKRAEEEEKNSRAKRLAARLKKEEEERERRETSREMRRREREEREQREREAKERKTKMAYAVEDARSSDMQADAGDSNGTGMIKLRLPQSKFNGINNGRSSGSGSGSRTPIGDDWELDCEICHRRGINLDDGTPMMSCGICSKWQHILCHDRADAHAGRKRRNWDDVEFFCLQCRSKKVGVGGTDSRVNQYPQSGAAGQPLRQSQNPYMVHTAAGAVPYNPNLYMGVIGHANYGVQNPDNGNGISYAREARTSHTRLTPSIPSGHPHQQVQPQQPYTQSYGSTIAFSHYQPQEGGFTTSSSSPGPYVVPGNIQTYGPQPHAGASTNPYMQYNSTVPITKGGAQLFPASQNRWNLTASTQVPSYPTSVSSYTTSSNTPTHYTQNMAPSVNVQGGSQWQFQHQASTGQQNTTQFQHHPSSYQPPAAPP